MRLEALLWTGSASPYLARVRAGSDASPLGRLAKLCNQPTKGAPRSCSTGLTVARLRHGKGTPGTFIDTPWSSSPIFGELPRLLCRALEASWAAERLHTGMTTSN